MSDLVEFLTARLDDDWAESLRWSHNIYGPDGSITGLDEAAVRVQREVDAKRRILERETSRRIIDPEAPEVQFSRHPDAEQEEWMQRWSTPVTDTPILRLLALPYADHPDYRQEWKP